MTIYRKFNRLARKAGKAIKKRYVAKPGGRKATGGYRVGKMAKDIMYLKSVLNPEKKRYENATTTPNLVGQVNGVSGSYTEGRYLFDCTPIPLQGVTYNTRNGASIKLHSTMWHFQFVQEASCVSDVKLCVEIFQIMGEPYTGFTFFNERYLENPFIIDGVSGAKTIRDLNSQINPDNFMKGKCIAKRIVRIRADQTTGAKMITDLKLPIKYNRGQGHHVRYKKDSIDVESGQLYIVIRADRGNIGTVAISNLSGVPDVAPNTGISMLGNKVDYFYDN